MSLHLVFDTPQAPLVPDRRGHRFYGNVDNAMSVGGVGSPYVVHVAVPTMLFPLMKEVLNIHPESEALLGLDLMDNWYVFSVLSGNRLFDLWRYPSKKVPEWILSREYRVYE